MASANWAAKTLKYGLAIMLIESFLIAPGFDQDEVLMVDIGTARSEDIQVLGGSALQALNAALNSSRESAGGWIRTTMRFCSLFIGLLQRNNAQIAD
jgi:hypothetical protein